MKLLFLCAVLSLIYSFADSKTYSYYDLETKLTELCKCSKRVKINHDPGKRETYQVVENRENEKHVTMDDLNPGMSSADEKKRNRIFGTRRKEDGISFLRKRGYIAITSCCDNLNKDCTINYHVIIEECIKEGCSDHEILEVC